ncbi:MAG TPA: hypothetical protein PKE55_02450 [Kiritimatiellia bacterium]|nr:hypothetical protein [Kiritimatiellia bacterium]
MSSVRKPSGWMQQNYDKLLLVVVLIALLGSGAFLLIRLSSEHAALKQIEVRRPDQPKEVQPIDYDLFTSVREQLHSPLTLGLAQRRMLVGDLRVASIPDGLPIPFAARTCPFTGAEQPAIVDERDRDTDGDGIPDWWEIKHGLNPMDPSDALMDSDGDGFSNLEEFLAGTDPNDPDDFPPPVIKMRLVRMVLDPFKLRFQGVNRLPDRVLYQLNLRTLERTFFVQIGEEVEGYKVVRFEPDAPEGRETLVLSQNDKEIRLVQGRVIDAQAKIALMVSLLDGSRYRLILGEEFEKLGKNYKVVDIREDRVVIRDLTAERDNTIGLISSEERQQLTGGGPRTP